MRAAVLILLVAAGCASAPGPSHVTLEPDGDAWRATWHLAHPARELRFERPADAFRSRTFEILTPGYAFARDGETELLRASGTPSRTITVRFREYTRHLPKDYEFFLKFSDGSVAIYTGHLLARPDGAADLVRRFRLAPPAGARMIVGGKRFSSPTVWSDDARQGTYVYFGSLEPVESADAISVVDPGLPDWLESRTREMLPRLFAFYARRLGVELPDRPTVLFHWTGSEQTGYSSSGGTLPGLVQLGIEGTGWKSQSDEGLLELFHFLGHEAAHLWNGQIVHYPELEHAWMHEGSADGLTERALLELGVIDEQRFLDYQTAALNRCRRGLGVEPLQTAHARGKFDLYYSCGNAVALLTEAARGRDLFSFWRALIERARSSGGGKYGANDYYAVMGDAAAVLRPLVERPADPDALVRALQSYGVVFETVDSPPQDYGQTIARDALMHLLAQQCKGRYGFNTTPDGLRLTTTCESGLEAGQTVTAIGGQSVLRAGHRAWDHLHARCGTAEPVTVTSGGREVSLQCKTPVAARPAYVRIVKRAG